MSAPCPRNAVRAILKHNDRLLLVNAYKGGKHPLMCAPGGGVETILPRLKLEGAGKNLACDVHLKAFSTEAEEW